MNKAKKAKDPEKASKGFIIKVGSKLKSSNLLSTADVEDPPI